MHAGYGNTVYMSLISLAFKKKNNIQNDFFKNVFPFIGMLDTNNPPPQQVLSGRVFSS